MGRSTEITGLKGRERLAEALREQSYPVLCLCWGGVGLVLSMARILGENAPFGVALGSTRGKGTAAASATPKGAFSPRMRAMERTSPTPPQHRHKTG